MSADEGSHPSADAPGRAQKLRHQQSTAAPNTGGPYSHAVIAGELVFLSGQRPQDPTTGEISDGVVAQTRQVMNNISAVLQSCGCTFDDVIKVGVHLADIKDFDEFNSVYVDFVRAPYPARTTVGSALRGILVEIDVVASLRAGTP